MAKYNKVNMTNISRDVWLIAINLDSTKTTPKYYILFFPGEADNPLLCNRKLVCFNKEMFIHFLDKNCHLPIEPDNLKEELGLICEANRLFLLLKDQDQDDNAVLINSLNTYFDILEALEIDLPTAYRKILYAFADHLTFHKEFEVSFFQKEKIARSQIMDAIYYMIGVIFTHLLLIEKKEDLEPIRDINFHANIIR